MEQAPHLAAHYIALLLEALALLVILIGAVEAANGILRVMLTRRASDADKRAVWLGLPFPHNYQPLSSVHSA
jgi:hypothetical protein